MKHLVPIIETDRLKCSPAITHEHYLQPLIHNMLQQASELLPPNIHLLVYEGFRPRSRQIIGWNRMMERLKKEYPGEDEKQLIERCEVWVANPYTKGSGHQAGAAVDVTLRRATGEELDMGTALGECNEFTAFQASGLVEPHRTNRNLLHKTMTAAGFINYPAEWWHYSYGDRLWAEVLGRPPSDVIFQPYMEG